MSHVAQCDQWAKIKLDLVASHNAPGCASARPDLGTNDMVSLLFGFCAAIHNLTEQGQHSFLLSAADFWSAPSSSCRVASHFEAAFTKMPPYVRVSAFLRPLAPLAQSRHK